jgi:hypothetical protein
MWRPPFRFLFGNKRITPTSDEASIGCGCFIVVAGLIVLSALAVVVRELLGNAASYAIGAASLLLFVYYGFFRKD